MKNDKKEYYLYTEKSVTHSQRKRILNKLDGLFSDIKGERSENRVEELLNFLKNVKFIESYIHSERHSDLDRMGVDFLIKMRNTEICLQVKSSISAVNRHKMIYPDIPVVCANIPEKDLLKHLMTVLCKACNKKINQRG